MKRILYILAFIFFGLFGVVNEGWCDYSPGNNYTLVTNISSLFTGDHVILFSIQNGEGITGYNDNKDATVSTISSNWKEYYVTKNTSSFTLKDGTKYIANPTDNEFKYGNPVGSCTVDENGLLTCNSRNLMKNGIYYRFYATSKNYINKFYVYKVTNNVSYTITAQSNNDLYGTVSLSGNVITGSPNSGYRYASPAYSISPANSAIVSQNGNEFTVTLSANTIVTINFEAIPTYTVNLNIDETLYASVTQTSEGETINLTDSIPGMSRVCELNGWQFVGWINSNDKDNKNLITTITPTKDTTLYALFKIKNNEYIEYITDTIYASKLQASGSEYKEFTLNEISDAKYYGYTANAKDTILQLNSGIHHDKTLKLHSGIITKLSGGFLSNIKVKWNDSTAADRMIEIYQSNNPYNTQEDLFGNGKLNYDSIKYQVSNELQLKDSLYLGVRAHNGAVFIDTIYITWSDGIGYEYSTNPQCFETNISVAEWFEDKVEFDIGDYEDTYTYNKPLNSCDSIRIVYTKDGKDCIRWFQVPIFAGAHTSKNDCNCDVVVLHDSTFTVSNNMANSNVYVYGTLIVNANKTYTINSLTLRRDNDSVPQLLYNGTLNIKNGMFFEMRTDGEDWRWLTLPDSIRLKPILGKSESIMKYYDGETRANYGRGGWKVLENDTTFGFGVIFGIDKDEKRIYTFKLDTNILSLEKERKRVYVKKFAPKSEPKNDIGWNLIGNPYMSTYNINPKFGTFIYSDSLVEEKVNGQWTGRWIIEEKHLRYIVVPSNKKDQHIIDAGGYEQICLQNGYKLKPFTSFFVQANKDDSLIFYIKGHIEEAAAPKRIKESNKNSESFLQFQIGSLKTGCYISNKFNDDYEIGDDMESLYQTYQLINGYKLLYSAINDSIINSGIHVYTNGGSVSLDDKTDINDFEEISIFYNGNWYDLLHGQTVNANGEFILQARRKQADDIPTDIEMIIDNNIEKFIQNNTLYIKKNNHIYNILGGVIK